MAAAAPHVPVPDAYDPKRDYLAGDVILYLNRIFAASCDIPAGNPPS